MRRALLVCAAITFAIACTDNFTEPVPDRPDVTAGAARANPTVAFATTTTEDGLSISTDRDDYSPGDVVHLTGSGWPANDVLNIRLDDEPATHLPHTWTIAVGADGTFNDATYVVDVGDLGVTFTLTATTTISDPQRSLSVKFTDNQNPRLTQVEVHEVTNCSTSPVALAPAVNHAVCARTSVLDQGGSNDADFWFQWVGPSGTVARAFRVSTAKTGDVVTDILPAASVTGGTWTVRTCRGNAPTPTTTVCAPADLTQITGGTNSVPRQFIVPAATKLAFTTAFRTAAVGQCTEVLTVQSQQSDGTPANVSGTTPLTLSSSSPGGTFHTNDACSTTGTVSIAGGANTASFYYKDSNAGTATITVSATGLGQVTQDQTINAGNTVVNVTSTPASPTVFGQSVSFTATVSPVAPAVGTPTGSVTFHDGPACTDTQIGSSKTLSGGSATSDATSSLSVAEHTITACYAGGGAFSSQSGQVAHTVNKAATSLALTKSPVANTVFGQTVVFTAEVSVTAPGAGTLVGDVKFYEFAAGGTCAAPNGTLLDTKTLASAEAQFSTSTLSATAHTINACYQGSTNFAGSGNSVSHTVEKALTSTVVTSSSPSNTSTYGDEVTFEATVSVVPPGGGTPAGDVKFIEGGTCAAPTTTHESAVAVSGGKAIFKISDLAAGSHTITACYVGNENYLASSDDVEQTVNKTPLTITAEDQEKFYGAATPAFTVKYEGFVLGEGASVLGGTLAFTLKDGDDNTVTPAASNPAGTYTITPGGQTSNNYEITFEDGKLTIKPAPLKITADDQEKFYGGAVPAFTASYEGFVLGETSSVLSGTLIFTVRDAANNVIIPGTSDPAGDYTVTPSGLSSNNYAITFVAGKLTVKPAPLTIAAENKEQFFGEPAPTFTVTYSGFVLGQNQSVLGGTLSFTFSGGITPGTTTPVGVYDVTPGGLTSTNYAITFQKGTYAVKEWSITGFYAPVDVPAGASMWNTVKGGSTVPLKFEVFAGIRELTDPGSTVKPQPSGFIAQGVQCPNNGLTDNIEFTTTGGTVLRYDATAGQFIQNWQTPKKPGTCYKTTMMTQDGSSIYAYFILK